MPIDFLKNYLAGFVLLFSFWTQTFFI